MKATKLLLAAAAFAGLVVFSFAGPGPEYWARMTENAKNKATIEAKAKVESAAKVAVCAACSCLAMKKS